MDVAELVHHGEALAWMRSQATSSADGVITDPPYANVSGEASWVERGARGIVREGQFYEAWVREHLREWDRVLKPSGAIWLTIDWFGALLIQEACGRLGMRSPAVGVLRPEETAAPASPGSPVEIGVWDRGGLGMGHVLRKTYECFVVIPMPEWKRRKTDVADVWPVKWTPSDRRRGHSAEKPVEIFARAIDLLVPEGGLVLDPFAGVGSSAIAALASGRLWRGAEREVEFIKRIRARLVSGEADYARVEAAHQPSLFQLTAPEAK